MANFNKQAVVALEEAVATNLADIRWIQLHASKVVGGC